MQEATSVRKGKGGPNEMSCLKFYPRANMLRRVCYRGVMWVNENRYAPTPLSTAGGGRKDKWLGKLKQCLCQKVWNDPVKGNFLCRNAGMARKKIIISAERRYGSRYGFEKRYVRSTAGRNPRTSATSMGWGLGAMGELPIRKYNQLQKSRRKH